MRHLRRRRHPCWGLHCEGNQLDALGECGGPCESDADADGICDDIDPCVGELDACGVCNGPGEIYECGCADIPEGDCDCNGNVLDECGICGGDGIPAGDCDCDGNQLDALGECGGPCEADADADGICDDVDPCVGELDACGICNGPGEIYECGCADIPEGDLRLRVLDECGIPVTASLLGTATATATSLTPLASAAVLVRPMRTPMASATTSTHVSENSTLVACATDRARSTTADALTSLKAIVTARATSLMPSASVAAADVNDNG